MEENSRTAAVNALKAIAVAIYRLFFVEQEWMQRPMFGMFPRRFDAAFIAVCVLILSTSFSIGMLCFFAQMPKTSHVPTPGATPKSTSAQKPGR
jgi:hypothetical protein